MAVDTLHRNAGFILRCLLCLSLSTTLAHAGDVQSTRLSGQPFDWNEINLWSHDPAVSTFPNNGNEGHTFDVEILSNLVMLQEAITIDSLDLFSSHIDLEGQTMTVGEQFFAAVSTISDGTISLNDVAVTSTHLILGLEGADVTATANVVNVAGNSQIRLNGASTFKINESITFTADGDLNNLMNDQASFDLSGALIEKAGGTSVTDITAKIITDDLTVMNASNNSSALRFNQHAQTWGDILIKCTNNNTVDFSVPLTMNDVLIENEGDVFFKGNTMLSGTLSASSSEFGAVTLSTHQDEGSLSGGIVDCDSNTPFRIEGFAAVGPFGCVMNEGEMVWQNGFIIEGGLTNEGKITTADPGARQVLFGSLINNDEVFHLDAIDLGPEGNICNNGTWFLASEMNTFGAPASGRLFTSTSIISVVGNSTINAPIDWQGTITMDSLDVTTNDAAHLHDLTIASIGGELILDRGANTDPDPEFRFDGTVNIVATTPVPELSILQIAGGDFINDGLISDSPNTLGADVLLTGDGSLSGGLIEIDDETSAFVQDGEDSVLAKTQSVTNLGTYELRAGTIETPGLVNLGVVLLRPDGPAVIKNLQNTSEVDHDEGSFDISAPGITNDGTWRAKGGSTEISYENDIQSGLFTNNGLFIGDDQSESESESESGSAFVRVDVFFDSPGTVIADNATILFTGGVAQYDFRSRELAAAFEVRNGGRIIIDDEGEFIIRKLVQPARLMLDDPDPNGMEPYEAIEALEDAAVLIVTGGTALDVTGNGNDGDFDSEGEFRDGESVLGPEGATPRFITNRFANRGRATVFNNGVVQANTAIDLLDGGILTGDLGVIETPIVNNISGDVQPGFPADFDGIPGPVDTTGQITINGNYDQQSNGTLTIELAGTAPGDSDKFVVTGDATLGGALVINAINGYEPAENDTFEILTAANVTGQFATISAPAAVDLSYLADRVVINFTGPACDGDFDMSGGVDSADLLALLGAWGTCPGCAQDINNDGNVDLTDLLALLGGWGTCE